MHKPQQQVRELHEAIDHPRPTTFTPLSEDRLKLRLSLIMEEAREIVAATGVREIRWRACLGANPGPRYTYEIEKPMDAPETLDGLCDLLVVTYGMAVEMGVDLEPFFDEVHRTNMAKVGGPTREDGKRLRPPGWVPPDIAGIFRRLYSNDPR